MAAHKKVARVCFFGGDGLRDICALTKCHQPCVLLRASMTCISDRLALITYFVTRKRNIRLNLCVNSLCLPCPSVVQWSPRRPILVTPRTHTPRTHDTNPIRACIWCCEVLNGSRGTTTTQKNLSLTRQNVIHVWRKRRRCEPHYANDVHCGRLRCVFVRTDDQKRLLFGFGAGLNFFVVVSNCCTTVCAELRRQFSADSFVWAVQFRRLLAQTNTWPPIHCKSNMLIK